MTANDRKEQLKLDQIMRVLFKLSTKVTVNLMNSLLDENFAADQVTITYDNGEFVDDGFSRIVGHLP